MEDKGAAPDTFPPASADVNADDGTDGGPEVEIGFVEPLSSTPPACLLDDADWHAWDGGKVGGRPVRVAASRSWV